MDAGENRTNERAGSPTVIQGISQYHVTRVLARVLCDSQKVGAAVESYCQRAGRADWQIFSVSTPTMEGSVALVPLVVLLL